MNIKGLREIPHVSPYFFAPQKSTCAPQSSATGYFVEVTFIPFAHSDVLFRHTNAGVPQLIACCSYILPVDSSSSVAAFALKSRI